MKTFKEFLFEGTKYQKVIESSALSDEQEEFMDMLFAKEIEPKEMPKNKNGILLIKCSDEEEKAQIKEIADEMDIQIKFL